MGFLDPKPLTPGALDAVAAGLVANPASDLAGELSATFVPKWKATTAYLAGDKVVNPAGDVVAAIADFTSGASYSAANWALPTTYLQQANDAYKVKRSQLSTTLDNRDAIQAIIDDVVATGIRPIEFPMNMVIPLGQQITIPANAHGLTIDFKGSTIQQIAGAVNKALIFGTGSDGTKVALTADATAGLTTLDVPSAVASTLSVGSLLGLECTTVVYGIGTSGQEGYASEIRKVTSVSGTTVTVDGPLLHPYATSAAAVAWKVTPIIGVTIRNLTMTSTNPTSVYARNIQLDKIQGLRLEGIKIRDSGGGIYVNDVIDAHLSNIEIDGLPNVSNFLGYGVAVGGRAAHIYIENLRGRNMRHLFTTLADERTIASVLTQWGGPRHVTIRGGVAEQSKTGTQYSLWDTHPYGYDIVFDQCRAYGGSSASSHGFQIRSKNTKLINPVALYSGGQGIRVDPLTGSEVEIVGGEIAYAAASGIGLGKNTAVKGVWIHNNTTAGISIGDTVTGSRVTDCRIEDNQYGIQDSSTGLHTGVIIQGNAIPKSVTQGTALLSPKSNLRYTFNSVPGYGVGNDGVGGTISATVIRARNDIDGIADPSAIQIDFCSTAGSNPAVAMLAAAASAPIGVANTGIAMPVKPHRDINLTVLEWIAGTTSAGNYDIAILDSTGARLWSKGSTAWPTASAVSTETVSPAVSLVAGKTYYIMLSTDSATATYKGLNVTSTLLKLVTGASYSRVVASVFPIPSTVTLGSTATGKLPVVMLREA